MIHHDVLRLAATTMALLGLTLSAAPAEAAVEPRPPTYEYRHIATTGAPVSGIQLVWLDSPRVYTSSGWRLSLAGHFLVEYGRIWATATDEGRGVYSSGILRILVRDADWQLAQNRSQVVALTRWLCERYGISRFNIWPYNAPSRLDVEELLRAVRRPAPARVIGNRTWPSFMSTYQDVLFYSTRVAVAPDQALEPTSYQLRISRLEITSAGIVHSPYRSIGQFSLSTSLVFHRTPLPPGMYQVSCLPANAYGRAEAGAASTLSTRIADSDGSTPLWIRISPVMELKQTKAVGGTLYRVWNFGWVAHDAVNMYEFHKYKLSAGREGGSYRVWARVDRLRPDGVFMMGEIDGQRVPDEPYIVEVRARVQIDGSLIVSWWYRFSINLKTGEVTTTSYPSID